MTPLNSGKYKCSLHKITSLGLCSSHPSCKGSPLDALPLPLEKEGSCESVCFPLAGYSFSSPSLWWHLSHLPKAAGFCKVISRCSVGVHQDHNQFCIFFQNFSDWFLVPASKTLVLTKCLQFWLLGLRLGSRATLCLQFLHEDMVSLINEAAGAKDANKAEVKVPLAKYSFLK